MQKRITIKNHYLEIHLITQRALCMLIFMGIGVFLLLLRLSYLQIYKNDVYATLSTKNWLDLVPVEPTRGLIFDRNGVLLAENITVFSVDILPYQVTDLNKTLNELKEIIALNDNDILQFRRQLKQHRRFDEIPLKLRLSEEETARFVERQHQFPGVIIKARLMRHYPYGKTFGHVLGYVGRINAQELNEIDTTNYSASHYIGKLGIEKYYENKLHGKVGYEEVENDASGKPIRVLKEIKAIPGKNIYLNIDSGLQFTAEKALKGHRGAIVAIDPQTGDVLALVSEPSFDPNVFVLGISQKDYFTLQQSTDKPLFNRALRGLYPLASTIKPYLSLQGLETGLISTDYSILDQGTFQLHPNSRPFHDSKRLGHGKVNLQKAIMVSCDIYFYDLANRLGIQKMHEILTQFGFGNLTGIDLQNEMTGVVATPDWKQKIKGLPWFEGDTIQAGIGQGFMQATPIQLANAAVTLANRGKRVVPHLLRGEQLPGATYVPYQPLALATITLSNTQYWETVINAMQNVVASPQGTAFRFGKKLSYTIAAKTGTAQVTKRRNPDEADKQEDLPEKLRDHHLFIAFAPIEKPKLALAIVTENSNSAVESARMLFDYYLGTQQNVNRAKNKIQKTSP